LTTEGPNTPGVAGATVGGRYILRTIIGSGGMGTVWKAYDRLLRRDVAIKEVLIPATTTKADRDVLIERTLREARAAASLNHPAVVRMYDVVTDGDRPWLVMELLTARSIAEIVTEDGPLSIRTTAKIGLAMLGALEGAHAAGILHRDVKPANVLINTDGRCVLTDFGVARVAEESDLTTPGMVLGSPHYIAPERALGETFGPPSDLFSLGVTLYTAVEGGPPFDRGNPIDTMHAVVQSPPEPPRNAGPLTPVLYRLLDKDPRRRWGILQTRTALRELIDGPLAYQQSQSEETDPHSVMRASLLREPTQRRKNVIGGRAMLAPGETPAQRHTHATASRQASDPNPARVDEPTDVPGALDDTYGQSTVDQVLTETYFVSTTPQHRPLPPALSLTPPLSKRPRWLLPASTVGIILGLLGTVGLFAGWFSPSTSSKPKLAASPTGPPFAVLTHHDQRGFSVNIPQGWVMAGNTYVDFTEPGNTGRRIRINVEPINTTSRRWAEIAAANLKKSSVCPDFTQLGINDVQQTGLPASELNYTCGTAGQLRHGLWRGTVSGSKVYTFYLTVPADRFAESAPIHAELVRSFRID
jgi:serine/threonine protein kinase